MEKRKLYIGSCILRMAMIAAAAVMVAVLVFILMYILANGVPNLASEGLFSWRYTSDNVSLMPALINTFVLTLAALLMAVPLGIATAVYLVEYAKRGNKLVKIIRVMSETLGGIPSIIYGLFGMIFFVMFLHWDYSIIAGSCTVAIMVLPTIISTTEEALMSVQDSYREGSFALGCGKLRTIFKVILPPAIPGILSGIILSTGRIVGETAALLYTSGSSTKNITGLFSSGRTLSVHMYITSSEGFHTEQTFATAVVLLVFVFIINTLSSIVAKRLGKKSGA